MKFFAPSIASHTLYPYIVAAYRADESQHVATLIEAAMLPTPVRERIAARARTLVTELRRQRINSGGIDAFMHEYELSSQEGVVLLCLAEALLRIPDTGTVDKLIRDKIASADWEKHLSLIHI